MTDPQTFAYRIRYLLLAAGIFFSLVGIWLLCGAPPFESAHLGYGSAGSPLFVPWLMDDGGAYVSAAFILSAVILLQWLFLGPRRNWLPRVTQQGRPMRRAVLVAAFMAMLLTSGLLFTILEFSGTYASVSDDYSFWIWWPLMIIIWLVWSGIFLALYSDTKTDQYTWMTRMIARLLAGSLIQIFIATAVYAWNPRNEKNCHCARGSYSGLVLGGTVLLWIFGPGLILLFMRETYRRERRNAGTYCFNCAYDLRGTIGTDRTTCPECGTTVSTEGDKGNQVVATPKRSDTTGAV